MREIIIFRIDKPERLKELALIIDFDFIGIGLHGWENWNLKDKNFCLGIRFLFFDLSYISYKMD